MPDAVKRPAAEVKDVDVCGTAWGGGEPDRERVASEFSAAAAVWMLAALFKWFQGAKLCES